MSTNIDYRKRLEAMSVASSRLRETMQFTQNEAVRYVKKFEVLRNACEKISITVGPEAEIAFKALVDAKAIK